MLLLLNALSTLALTGLIWFVQVVHYPLFRLADVDNFSLMAAEHQRRTTWVVAPLMLVEAATATLLLLGAVGQEAGGETWALAVGWLLLATIWVSTFVVQVPLHRRLLLGHDLETIRSLVKSNWIRTISWSSRSILAVALLGLEASR